MRSARKAALHAKEEARVAAEALVNGATPEAPAIVHVLDAWGDTRGANAFAIMGALLDAHAVVRWHAPLGPTRAERWLCENLRAHAHQRWLILDADALLLMTRSQLVPGVPDVVRLARRSGALLVGLLSSAAKRSSVPPDNRFLSWAEKLPIEPLFCG